MTRDIRTPSPFLGPRLQAILGHPATWVVLGLSCTVLDRWSGPHIQFPIAYAIPVALAAWHRGLAWAIPMSFLFALARLGLFFPDGQAEGWGVAVMNAAIRAAVLMFLAGLTRRTAELTRHVQRLEGLLPICAWCKRIRDEQGAWIPLDILLSRDTDVVFTHGICPDCKGSFQGQAKTSTH